MADLITSRVFTDGERGITAQKLNDIVGSSVIQPAFYTSKPTAGTADPADVALILKSGAYAQVPISTLAGAATQAQIWSTRLRSYNAIGNSNFEVDQRNVGAAVAPISGGFAVDRWFVGKVGTMIVATQQGFGASNLLVPGTSFQISSKYLGLSLNTQQVSLGTGDVWYLAQYVEGSAARELFSDVSSISLLVLSSVAGLKFSVGLRDSPAPTKSLVKLCTIPTANQWTLITLPNIPAFPSGNFNTNPGQAGYQLVITLACGTTLIAPAADTWQTGGSFVGAPGMSNFAGNPVNSTFQIAFIQHEPGAVCSTLMDKPFSQNYDECLRYYCKSYPYATVGGAPSINGYESFFLPLGTATNTARCSLRFPKPMAKVPTVNMWSYDGTANGLTIYTSAQVAGNFGVTTIPATERGVGGIVLAANTSTIHYALIGHYTADTGW